MVPLKRACTLGTLLLGAALTPSQAASPPNTRLSELPPPPELSSPDSSKSQFLRPISFPKQQLVQQPPVELPSLQPISPPPRRPESLEALPDLGPEQLPLPEELLQPPPESPVEPELDLETLGAITVERFNVVGSTVFREDELAALLKPYIGRPITFVELLQARSVITRHYIDEGYVTSAALIPAGQVIRDGVVTIQVIEGELETINIEGLQRLNSTYPSSRIQLAAGSPLNVDSLLQGLQLLQLDPLIESLTAELVAGTQPEQSILNVQAAEAPTFRARFILDNGRSPRVGSLRRSAFLTEANLLGLGDALNVIYSNTDGSNTWDIDYTVPFNSHNGAFKVLFSTDSSEIIEEPLDFLNIKPNSRTWEFSVRQPIVQTPNEELALSLAFTHRRAEAFIGLDDGTRIPLSEEANAAGETRLSALRFAQEWTRRDPQQVLSLRSRFNLGTDWLNATNNEGSLADSQFFSWQGQAQWARQLGPDTLLLINTNTQLTVDPLLSLEQFSLGGAGSVRGYRQDQLLTDNGVFASAELRVPILRIPEEESLLQLTPFIDYGYGWNSGRRGNPDPNQLVSVGLGLLWQTSDRFTARLDWGIPLTDVQSNQRTLQDAGILFSIVVKPF